MRIYLAARYSRREELRQVACMLVERGHKVVSEWVFRDDDELSVDRLESSARQAHRVADRDVRGIQSCDLLVQFSGDGTTQGGKHFELALAWAYRKECVIVGPPENLFQFLPGIRRVKDLSGLGDVLAELSAEEIL